VAPFGAKPDADSMFEPGGYSRPVPEHRMHVVPLIFEQKETKETKNSILPRRPGIEKHDQISSMVVVKDPLRPLESSAQVGVVLWSSSPPSPLLIGQNQVILSPLLPSVQD
jgi:hypothetical protein